MTDRLPLPINVRWHKSSYCDSGAGCVELAILDQASWRKASYSNTGAGCVELAHVEQAMAVRDSKHPAGPVLTFTAPSFRTFLTAATRY